MDLATIVAGIILIIMATRCDEAFIYIIYAGGKSFLIIDKYSGNFASQDTLAVRQTQEKLAHNATFHNGMCPVCGEPQSWGYLLSHALCDSNNTILYPRLKAWHGLTASSPSRRAVL